MPEESYPTAYGVALWQLVLSSRCEATACHSVPHHFPIQKERSLFLLLNDNLTDAESAYQQVIDLALVDGFGFGEASADDGRADVLTLLPIAEVEAGRLFSELGGEEPGLPILGEPRGGVHRQPDVHADVHGSTPFRKLWRMIYSGAICSPIISTDTNLGMLALLCWASLAGAASPGNSPPISQERLPIKVLLG